MICRDCEWARRVGDNERPVVGCALIYAEEVDPRTVVGDRFSGWMYINRRPTDLQPSKELGKGAMVNGPNLVSTSASCPRFKPHTS